MDLFIENYRRVCSERKVTFQPLIVCVGVPDKILASYIVIDDIKYMVPSLLRAVDVIFKVFHVLDCQYPASCQPVWTFIQKYIFEIDSKFDKHFASVNKLICSLNSI